MAALALTERRAVVLRWLVARAATLLGGRVPEPDEPLTGLGLDSLAAAQLRAEAESALGATVPLADLLEGCSAAALADLVLAGGSGETDAGLSGSESAALDGDQPLSAGQKALWFLHRLAPESAAYTIAGAARLRGDVEPDALRRIFQTLVDRHPALRVTFAERPDGPVQRVAPAVVSFLEEDAAGWSEEELRRRLHEEAFRPFDLELGPVFRIALFSYEAERFLVVSVHHIAADFWSLAVLVRELGTLIRDGGATALPHLGLTVFDHARWQERFLAGPDGERLWQYWRQRLAGLPPLDLPTDRPRLSVPSLRGGRHGDRLGPELAAAVRGLARSQVCTVFVTLLAAYQILLARHSGQEDFAVGVPTSGRPSGRLAGLVGYFVEPLALRSDLSGHPRVTDALARIRRGALEAFAHQGFPFALLAERLEHERAPGRSPLFQTMLVLQKAPTPDLTALARFALGEGGALLNLGGLELESVALDAPAAQFDLTLVAAEAGDDIGMALQWSADLFDAATTRRMLGHFSNLLRAMAVSSERPIGDLDLLSEGERQQLEAWTGAGGVVPRSTPGDLCLHQLFEAQAAFTPDAPALLWRGERLTYRSLNHRANRLAHRLRRLGVGQESLVAVLLDRSPDLVAALIAVLKAGGAYLPLDPAYPREWLESTLAVSGVAVLLTRGALADGLPPAGVHRLSLDADREGIAVEDLGDPQPLGSSGNLAYVLYTSGSTGRPKGVAVEHRSPVARMFWAREAFRAEERTGVLASTSVCFDLSVFELFVPLSWGGMVVLADNALALPSLAEWAEVTLVNTVPSAMAELAEGELPPRLRAVNLAGEVLPARLVKRIHSHPQVRRVLNLYGPSEDTTYSTFGEVARGVDRVTIGRPLAGTQARILDADLQRVPVGIPGELCLAGVGLARGYAGRPDLTAERFVPSSFGAPGGRLYRTGDLARWQPEGEIEFLGRLDHQVKVRGFRIEPGEIEAILGRHPGLGRAVVVAQGEGGDRCLVAYVEPFQEPPPDAGELRRFLVDRLPAHMVPAAFVVLARLPRTSNGKVDRRALPDPGRLGQEEEIVAPRSDLEELLAGIWAEVLQTDPISVHTSFFAAGGHSLKAFQALSKIRMHLGVELPIRSLFETPTVAGMAVTVIKELARQAGDEAAGMLEEVESSR